MTQRQYGMLCAGIMLSSMLRLLPHTSAAEAGRAAWLCGPAALLPLLGFAALTAALLRRRRAGEGLSRLILRALGCTAGKLLLLLYALWFTGYAAFLLRSSAERFVATIYPFSHAWPFAALLLALCLTAALGPPRALFRAAEIFYPLLFAVFVFTLLFAAPDLRIRSLLPVTLSDAGGILRGALPIVNIGAAVLTYPAFLSGPLPEAAPSMRTHRTLLLRLGLWTLFLNAFVVGSLGAELTVNLSHPFFTMLRNVSVFHAVERFEALVVGLWLLPDFLLVSLMLILASMLLRTVFGTADAGGGAQRRGLTWLCALAALAGGLLLAPDAFALRRLSHTVIPLVNLCFTVGVLPVVYLVGRLRKTL